MQHLRKLPRMNRHMGKPAAARLPLALAEARLKLQELRQSMCFVARPKPYACMCAQLDISLIDRSTEAVGGC